MIQTAQAKDISLGEIKKQFNLQLTTEPNFFNEWQSDLPVVSAAEQKQIARIQQNYFNLAERKSFSEESIELSAEDEGLRVKGKIDVLVVKEKLWVLVVESKSTRFDVVSALPQALTYLLSAPNKEEPVYGLVVNGREFLFVKLQHGSRPIYARSFALSIERENELKQVLGILKTFQRKMTT